MPCPQADTNHDGVIDYEEFIPVLIGLMQTNRDPSRRDAASTHRRHHSALEIALKNSYEKPTEVSTGGKLVQPQMPTARYDSAEALAQGRFPYVPRRRGQDKPEPGMHSDALIMRSHQSAANLNDAVGSDPDLMHCHDGGEGYTTDGSRVLYNLDGGRVTVRADASTVVETPYEHPILFAPTGRHDLVSCFQVQDPACRYRQA